MGILPGVTRLFLNRKSPQTRINFKKNVPDSKIGHICWWEKVDSNLRITSTANGLSRISSEKPVALDFTGQNASTSI